MSSIVSDSAELNKGKANDLNKVWYNIVVFTRKLERGRYMTSKIIIINTRKYVKPSKE